MTTEWQYHLLKLMSRALCCLPYSWLLSLGDGLGKVYYHAAGRQRKRALDTVRECLELSEYEAEQVVRRLFNHLGKTFLEVLYMPSLTPAKIKNHVVIENEEILWKAVAENKGVVLLTAHIGNWEWLGATLALGGFPLTSVIKRQPNDQHTRILNEYRQLVGIEIFARGTTELVGAAKAMKRGKILGFLADQDAGEAGIFVPFLGKMASTPLGPAVFAKRFEAPVVPVFIVRNGGQHRVLIYPPLKYTSAGSDEADLYNFTQTLTGIIEDTIRRYPENWLWFQKRWNTPYIDKEEGGAS